jgi:hypothetical protein
MRDTASRFANSRAIQWLLSWLRKRRIDNILYVWLAIPALCLVVYGVGYPIAWLCWGQNQQWQRWWTTTLPQRDLFPQGFNLLYATGWFWAWAVVMSVVSFIIWHGMKPTNQRDDSRKRNIIFHASMGLVTLLTSFQFVASVWEDDKDAGRFNAGNSVFVVNDINNLPESLAKEAEGLENGKPGQPCLKVSGSGKDDVHDTPSCIIEGDVTYNWDDRIASANAAKVLLGRSGESVANTYLMESSITYLHGEVLGDGVWSGIRDGKNGQGPYGVAQLDRNNNVSACPFTGKYKLNQSFSGSWGHNLRGLLASKYPNYLWDDRDVWGYCTASDFEPVIVILPTLFVGTHARAVRMPAGVITVQGSPTGNAVLNYYPNVEAGGRISNTNIVLSGPAYPSTLVAEARDSTQWQAGRRNRNRNGFGFDPASKPNASDDTNVSEHLRRAINTNGTPGREYWDTPLTSRNNDTVTFNAYSTTSADEVHRGKLNETRIYVFNEKDPTNPQATNPLIVNRDDLTSSVKGTLSKADPGFFAPGVGSLVEFIPRNPTTWIAFGEITGRVKYRFEIPTNLRVQPTVIDLDTGKTVVGPTARNGNEVCFAPPEMTSQEAGACISAIGEELKNRKDTKPTVAQPTPSATASPAPR